MAPKTGGDQDFGEIARRRPNVLGIKILAQSVYVEDVNTAVVLLEKNADEPRPIASITKLMTALVFLDQNIPWDREITIQAGDKREGGTAPIYEGDRAAVRDLFIASLANSANNTTAALVRASGLPEEIFVEQMNEKARAIGLPKARFTEPTGLDPRNMATAREVTRLAQNAFANADIKDAIQRWRYWFSVRAEDGEKERKIMVKNTDYLLESFLNSPPYTFIGGKTGFINEAGWCLVGEVEGPGGRRVIGVVLGAPSHLERFTELKKALWWAFEFFE